MKKVKSKKAGIIKRTFFLIVLAVSIIVIYISGLGYRITSYGEHTKGAPSDVIIVLGAAVWNGKPSPALRERLDVALQAWKDKKAPVIIGSGGTNGEELSEGETMKRYLVAGGVPASKIIVEDDSYSTMENLQNSKAIMDKKGYHSAVIVTHAFHAYRASLMAKSIGIEATVEPVTIRPIDFYYYTFRECLGVTWFILSETVHKMLKNFF